MALFDVSAILTSLIKQMGIGPDQVAEVVQTVQRINTALAEIDAFKTASQQVVTHFNARLERIDARLARIETPPVAIEPRGLNGDATHV